MEMEILVFSDSHGRAGRIREAIDRQIKKPDAIIFLGDGLRDIASIDTDGIPIMSVAGNCDLGSMFSLDAPEERCVFLGDKKIFFTHGHRYGVKSTLMPLINEAVEREADILLYGHTHEGYERELMPDNEYGIRLEKPLYIMNPGSIGSYPYIFGAITVDKAGRVLLSHGTLEK